MTMSIHKIIIAFLAAASIALPAYSVTKEEMEQARVIAAQCYLRYANNGSGYLDEINPKSMSDLEKKLKKKEIENLKAFKAINLPSDYSSWDKDKLVSYWSITFLNSPKLLSEGKAAKNRIKNKISALAISTPTANEPKKHETKQNEGMTNENTAVQQAAEEVSFSDTVAPSTSNKDIAEERIDVVEKPTKNNSGTWIYVAILTVLVGIVLWLVVYASRTMGKQPGRRRPDNITDDNREEMERMESKFNNALIAKNTEIRTLNAKLAKYESAYEELNKQNKLLQQENEQLHNRNNSLEQEIIDTKIKVTDSEKKSFQTEPLQQKTGSKERAARIIFLGRVNAKGIFVRADREFNPTHDVYSLSTRDGLTGSFEVVDDTDLMDLIAISAPTLLGNGCIGLNLNSISNCTRILTTTPGIAVFENGYWKVFKKAEITAE